MMTAGKLDNAGALSGLERQSARLPVARVKILNKFRRLIGLCLLDGGFDGAGESLQQGIVKLCTEIGLPCSCAHNRDRTVESLHVGGGVGSEPGHSPLPSCQVSVEEKKQLFSFLRKG